jgi:signal peptidase I
MLKKEDMPQDINTEEEPINVAKEILSWILTVAAAVVVALLLNNFVLINAKIPSGSMENTIKEGDRLIGNRLAYIKADPKRGDIVIFKFPDDESQNYVKRVIGLPGETVRVEAGKVYINNSKEPLKETYLKEKWTVETGPYLFQVPKDCYLVMGDNRNNSYDARYWTNTYVKKDKILGKAGFRYFPFNKIGFLH